MEIKRVVRAFKYKPKYKTKEDRPFGLRAFPVFVGFVIVGMALSGLWLTKVVEQNINEAIINQISLVQTRPQAMEKAEATENAVSVEPRIDFQPDYLVRPVQSKEVIRGIGWSMHPRFGYWFYHDGIDLAVSPGDTVRGVGPGVVAEIIRNYDEEGLGVTGNRVVLSHGQRGNSVYIFSGEVLVSPGESVTAGTALGTVVSDKMEAVAVHVGISWDGRGLDWLSILENRG